MMSSVDGSRVARGKLTQWHWSGGWVAGLLYDHFGYYAPAFAVGIGANILNLLMVSVLVGRRRHRAVHA
jgi:hypothetical protein